MKKNKKLLVLFLALNSILTSYADTAGGTGMSGSKYERIYNNKYPEGRGIDHRADPNIPIDYSKNLK